MRKSVFEGYAINHTTGQWTGIRDILAISIDDARSEIRCAEDVGAWLKNDDVEIGVRTFMPEGSFESGSYSVRRDEKIQNGL